MAFARIRPASGVREVSVTCLAISRSFDADGSQATRGIPSDPTDSDRYRGSDSRDLSPFRRGAVDVPFHGGKEAR